MITRGVKVNNVQLCNINNINEKNGSWGVEHHLKIN